MRPDEMGAAILANMPAKTGRTIDEWAEVVRANAGLTRRKEQVTWLKQEYGLGHVYAEYIVGAANRTGDEPDPTPQEWLDSQYAGPKAGLRPIYDLLVSLARALGADVEVEPRMTYVSLIRRRQFGVIQASTKTRLDLGLRLPGVAPTARLREAGSFGSGGVTHRVSLTALDDVDDEIAGWLTTAYAMRAT